MARKLGQDFLDAHVVEYRLIGAQEAAAESGVPEVAGGEMEHPGQAGDQG
jgi:hypothetical protein